MTPPATSPRIGVHRAESLGAGLPPLLVAAERVAATVAQGVHGRRRVGQGDSFWQFRPFVAGDEVAAIDWRQTAKGDRAYVRDTEWEAAQTVLLWRHNGPSMHWRSRFATVEKGERADLLLLALAALLLRAGERVALLGRRPGTGRFALERLAAMLEREASDSLPGPAAAMEMTPPRHAAAVLIGDFLDPLAEIEEAVGHLAARHVRGHILQVLDPAEILLPYTGRVRFLGIGLPTDTVVPRVEGIREEYSARLAAQQDGLAAIARAAGWSFATHRTDHPPELALLALHAALAPRREGRAGGPMGTNT
jgi:uncharacterized protein (DUF58 family)